MSQGVRAFPTFQFLINSQVIDEIKGANQTELENKVNQHLSKGKTSAFSGQGNALGGSSWNGVGYPPGSEREARLKAFGQSTNSGPQATPAPKPTPSAAPTPAPKSTTTTTSITPPAPLATSEEDEEEAVARAIALSMSSSSNNSNNNNSNTNTGDNKQSNSTNEQQLSQENDWDEEMVPVPVNEEYLTQLLDMGIEEVRARKGLVHGSSVEGAIAWIGDHQDDPDIDQPYMVKKKDAIPKVFIILNLKTIIIH